VLPGKSGVAIAHTFVVCVLLSGHAIGAPVSVAEFGQLALRCGPSAAPSTLAAIAHTESAFQPLAINDNTTGTAAVPPTRQIAIQIASSLLEAGHSVDLGIMQINSANFAPLGLTLESAFDPCKSITAAAVILAGDYTGGRTHEDQQAALRVAISKYNTGDAQRGFANGYVHRVELAVGRVVPALDVGSPQGTTSPPSESAGSTPVRVDPNAPPSWDVWSSFEYAATHQQDKQPVQPAGTQDLAVLADAEKEPAAAAILSDSTGER
jgi:type IV secretion system protein VirB1